MPVSCCGARCFRCECAGGRARFSAEKPRRLRQSTGLSPRAAFRARIPTIRKQRFQKESLFLVPVAGLEPARCCHRWILSPLRLPIPTHRRVQLGIYSISAMLAGIFHKVAALQAAGCCQRLRYPTIALAREPSSLVDRGTCCTLAVSATGSARVHNSGFASTSSTNSNTPAGSFPSIVHFFQKSKSYF